jgi:ATPase subunit of ABC transporter with duplicated ATPase domains
MGDADEKVAAKAMRRYGNLTERFEALGGYAAEAEAASIAHNLSLPDRILDQPLKTLSGGQRRRIELARILFSDAQTMILDEPTNHLDADSVVWLREFLKNYKGGLIVISHDVELVGETVNRVFYLDAMRQVIDIYNMNWKNYLRQRVADEERRKKERANIEKKATALQLQAARFGAKASKAAAAHQMVARAEKMLSGLEEVRQEDRVAKLRFPSRALRQDAAHGEEPLQVVRIAGDLHRRRPRDRSRLEGRRARSQRRRQDDTAADPRRRRQARHRRARAGPRPEDRLLRAGAREPRRQPLGAREHDVGGARHQRDRGAQGARLVPVHGRRRAEARRSALRREKTRLSLATLVVSSANMLLLDEPTNNLDPASREEILGALAHYEARWCSSRTTRAPCRR